MLTRLFAGAALLELRRFGKSMTNCSALSRPSTLLLQIYLIETGKRLTDHALTTLASFGWRAGCARCAASAAAKALIASAIAPSGPALPPSEDKAT
jgi:hypothetical protein